MSAEESTIVGWRAVGFGAAALLFAVVFGPSLGSGFVYDDHLLVVDNPFVHGFEYVGRAFSTHFWDVFRQHDDTLHYYRPLVTLSYIVDWNVSGGRPWSFHSSNVLMHALAVLLAATWARRLVGQGAWLLPVALFFVHPSRAESVYWVSGRTDVMVTVFLLLAVEAAHRAEAGARWWWGVFGASALCAFLSKEVAVILPFLLLARVEPSTRRSRVASATAGALAVSYLVVRALVFPPRAGNLVFTGKLGLLTVEGFAERLLWPWPQTMFFRTRLALDSARLELAGGALILVLVIAAHVVAWRRDRAAFWLMFAAVAALLPVSNLVESGLPVLASDRFLYLPILLGALGATRLVADSLQRWSTVVWVRMVGVGLLTLMCIVLVSRLPPFEDNEAFWSHELAIDRCNPVGLEYRANQAARRGEVASAVGYLEQMLVAPCVVRTQGVERTLLGKTRVRHLALKAALTPDGDVVELERLLAQLLADRSRHGSERVNLDAALVVLATRLGRDPLAEKYLPELERGDLSGLAAPANLVLTLARLGLFERSRKLLSRLRANQPVALIDEATTGHLAARVKKATFLDSEARRKTGAERAELLALAQAELGAYLRALRILAPIQRRQPPRSTRVLFVQLLVMARLEDDALAVLSRADSPKGAQDILKSVRRRLPKSLQTTPRVPRERGPRFLHHD